jgi:hypothetical protein
LPSLQARHEQHNCNEHDDEAENTAHIAWNGFPVRQAEYVNIAPTAAPAAPNSTAYRI